MADTAAQRAFLESKGQKLTPKPKASKQKAPRTPLKPGKGLERGKGIRQESPKQKDKKKLWAFIKLCFVICQKRTLGYVQCMRCGAINPPKVELHHMEHAGKGGAWSPWNAELICAGPDSCHEREHGRPEWSKSA